MRLQYLPSFRSCVFTIRNARKLIPRRLSRRLVCLVVALSLPIWPSGLAFPLISAKASAVDFIGAPLGYFPLVMRSIAWLMSPSPQEQDTMESRTAAVAHLRLSPTRQVAYVNQTFPLSALPTDSLDRIVHGVKPSWQSSIPELLSISETGQATALLPGLVWVTCRVGSASATAPVLIRAGQRPRQTDTEWLADQARLREDGTTLGRDSGSTSITTIASAVLDKLAPTAHAQIGPPPYDDFFYDEFYTEPRNLIGSPNNRAVESARMGTVHPEGSNFTFAVPILSLGGRGVGVDLTLFYNSRLWFRHGSAITFNPVYSWPAPGCTLGFGRIITYGPPSALKYVFIDRDGTRRFLGVGGTASQTVTLQTSDGTHITYVGNATTGGTIFYNNGTQVTISNINNRLLSSVVQNSNGNYLTITYKGINYPPMAIDFITDSLGRVIQFFYGSSGLSHIGAPAFGGTIQNPLTRVLAQFHYQSQTISNSFSGLMVENVADGNGGPAARSAIAGDKQPIPVESFSLWNGPQLLAAQAGKSPGAGRSGACGDELQLSDERVVIDGCAGIQPEDRDSKQQPDICVQLRDEHRSAHDDLHNRSGR